MASTRKSLGMFFRTSWYIFTAVIYMCNFLVRKINNCNLQKRNCKLIWFQHVYLLALLHIFTAVIYICKLLVALP